MTNVTTTAANATLHNASSDVTSAFGSSTELVPLLVVVAVLAAGLMVGSSVARISWVHDKLKVFSRTLYYAIVGGLTAVALGAVAYPVYRIAQADPGTRQLAVKALAAVVGGYVVLSVLGYVIDRTVLTNLREYMAELEGADDDE
jgi:hypothetical protein